MRRRDTLAAVCAAVMLVGIAGAFGVWMALICGGLLGIAVIVGLTLSEQRVKTDA